MSREDDSQSQYKSMLLVVGLVLVFVGVVLGSNPWAERIFLFAASVWKDKMPMPHWTSALHFFAWQILLSGVLFVAFGWLIGVQWRPTFRLAQDKRVVLGTAIAILSILWLPIALFARSEVVAGERYWWLYDDAMVSMRYARNLVQGIGLAWNPGERVEGYTNFLWTIYMAFVHLLPVPDSKTSLIVLVTNVLIGAATLPSLYTLVRSLGGNTLATLATLAAFIFSANVIYWATFGMKTALLTWLFLQSICRVIREARDAQPRPLTYLAIAMLTLVRADGLVLAAIVYAFALWLNKNKKPALCFSVLSLSIPVAYEIFRIGYYGDWLPNTAYLKIANWDGRFAAGLEYLTDFARTYVIFFAFAVCGAVLLRQQTLRALAVGMGVYLGYILYAGGDAFPNFRFLLPILPLLTALAFIGMQGFGLRPVAQFAFSLTSLALIPLVMPSLALYTPDPEYGGNVKIGLELRQNTPATSKVADSWAGVTLYFSGRYGVDLLGKSDRYIARLPVTQGTKPGHNKFDFDYSLGKLHPDYVIANFKLPVDEQEMQQVATGDWAHTALLYYHPLFREHCLPNPVFPGTWRTIFRCDWSQVELTNLLTHARRE